MITIEGRLRKIRFHDTATRYTVADLTPVGRGDALTVVGPISSATPGQMVSVTGEWTNHPRYGRQFKISACRIQQPTDAKGMQQYLQSGLIQGIGPVTAGMITAFFGDKSLDVIENAPDRLLEVPGIGPRKAALIRDAWQEHHTITELMNLLASKGVDASHSTRIFRAYGPEAIRIIRENPFQLAEDIPGAGFLIADTIALHSGLPPDNPERVRSCLRHLVSARTSTGNVFTYGRQLLNRCETLFQIDIGDAEAALEDMIDSGDLISDTMPGSDPDIAIIYPPELYEAETGAAARLKILSAVPTTGASGGQDGIMEEIVRRLAIQPSSEQLQVLENIFHHRVLIVTGGPGTGKTTLIQAMTALLEGAGKTVTLAAPTGRAAKRLAEVSGRPAGTIHKLLGFGLEAESFIKHRKNPLASDAVIIDEASMVDLPLFYHLLNATPASAVLVLVGDVFQLPAVGPGNVLSDLIRSEVLPVFHLTEIFRQARRSAIITNAHCIRRGEAPDLTPVKLPQADTEFCFIAEDDPAAIARTIVTLCESILPDCCDLDPLTDIQVLTPMHQGMVGTINLNLRLQKALNPGGTIPAGAGARFKPGDKVMHLRNNYPKEVFNGDIGAVAAVDPVKRSLSVNYFGRLVEYDDTETDQLSLAYAITVHKSQGSEYPAVIVPMTTEHYPLLQRNLLYTAVTRARRMVVLIGTEKAIRTAMKKNLPDNRLSLLAYRLNPDLAE